MGWMIGDAKLLLDEHCHPRRDASHVDEELNAGSDTAAEQAATAGWVFTLSSL